MIIKIYLAQLPSDSTEITVASAACIDVMAVTADKPGYVLHHSVTTEIG